MICCVFAEPLHHFDDDFCDAFTLLAVFALLVVFDVFVLLDVLVCVTREGGRILLTCLVLFAWLLA